MLKLTLALLTAVVLPAARAQPDGPIPRLNPNPTDTANPRLVGKAFPYDELPYQIDTSPRTLDPPYRGPQAGYNQCNDTTFGPESRCQTLIVNDLADFCLYAPQTLDTVGNAEPDVVAWCTQPTHGTRLIPPGTITGAQFIQTPSYIEFTGFFNQTRLNIRAGDAGGELDSGGQDARGNPMGGITYSINMPSKKGEMSQGRMWHMFIGNNMFCMKFCDETAPNASGLCRHTLDTVGCNINVPAAYRDNVFESCEGEDQQPVQLGVTAIPASSNCQTFASTQLWPTTTSATVGPTATASGGGQSGTGGASGTTTRSGSGPGATAPPGDGAERTLTPLAAAVAIMMLTIGAFTA